MAEFFEVEELIGINQAGKEVYQSSFINPDHILKITYMTKEGKSYVIFSNEIRPNTCTLTIKGDLTKLLVATGDAHE